MSVPDDVKDAIESDFVAWAEAASIRHGVAAGEVVESVFQCVMDCTALSPKERGDVYGIMAKLELELSLARRAAERGS